MNAYDEVLAELRKRRDDVQTAIAALEDLQAHYRQEPSPSCPEPPLFSETLHGEIHRFMPGNHGDYCLVSWCGRQKGHHIHEQFRVMDRMNATEEPGFQRLHRFQKPGHATSDTRCVCGKPFADRIHEDFLIEERTKHRSEDPDTLASHPHDYQTPDIIDETNLCRCGRPQIDSIHANRFRPFSELSTGGTDNKETPEEPAEGVGAELNHA